MKTFSTFFTDNHSFVVGVAERRLGSRHDAEEVAARAFEIAWERHQKGEALTVPWLYGVVRNLIGDEYRRRERSDKLQHRLDDEFAILSLVSDDLYSEVRDAVERLPLSHREVLKMTYWERLTASEIATVLGVRAIAVRARLMRARRLLRAALAELDEIALAEVLTHE